MRAAIFGGAALAGFACFGANSNSAEAAAPTNKVIVSKNHDKAKWTLVEDLRFTNGLDRTLWTQFAYHPWQMKRPPSIITNENLAYAADGLLHLNAELNPKIDETYSYMGRGGRLWTRGKLNLHYGKVTHRYPKISDRKEDWPWTEPNYLRLEIMAENAVGSWVGSLDPSTLPFECRVESVKLYMGEMDGKPFGKVIWLDGRR